MSKGKLERFTPMCVLAGAFLAGYAGLLSAEEPPPSPTPTPDPVAEAVRLAEEKLWGWQTKDAKDVLEPVKEKAKTHTEVAKAWARVLLQEKKHSEAIKLLEEVGKLAPKDASLQLTLGEAYLLANKAGNASAAFRRAKELAEEVLKANEGDAQARLDVALAQQHLKELDRAAENLERLVREGQDNDPVVLYHLGVTRCLQGKWAQALETLTKALELNKGLAYAYYYRALAADKLGKKDLLINDMDRFLHLAPHAPEASRAQAILAAAKR